MRRMATRQESNEKTEMKKVTGGKDCQRGESGRERIFGLS